MNGSNWIDGMPQWFKIGAVIIGLLSLGAAGGKTVSDFTGSRAIVAAVQANQASVEALRLDVQRQTCVQVAQLRKTDWTLCLVPNGPH